MSLSENKIKMKMSATQKIKQAVIQIDIFLNRVIDKRRLWVAGFSMGLDLLLLDFLFRYFNGYFFFDRVAILFDK